MCGLATGKWLNGLLLNMKTLKSQGFEKVSLCVWSLYFAGDVEGVGDIEALAAATEDCIFNEFKNTEVKYKNRVISRVANLKVSFHLSHL